MTQPPTEKHDLERHELLFGIRRSVRYHTRRRLFFGRLHETIKLILLSLFSIFVTAALIGQDGKWLGIFAGMAFVFVLSVGYIVRPIKNTRNHTSLSKRFIELEKLVVVKPHPSPEEITQWTVHRLDIETSEPPILRVLDSLCHNDMLRSMGYPASDYLKISWYQRMLAQFFDCRDHTIRATSA